jgi:hypothetical protein
LAIFCFVGLENVKMDPGGSAALLLALVVILAFGLAL